MTPPTPSPRNKAAYEQPQAGEWIQPVKKGYSMACCDCGLVHTLDFRIKAGRVQFRVFRNNRKTAAIRRWMKTKETIAAVAKRFAPALKRLAKS